METTQLQAMLKASISEILNTMFFMPNETTEYLPPEASALLENNAVLGCTIDFLDQLSGQYTLLLDEYLLQILTENMTGLSVNEFPTIFLDETLKELGGMVSGLTLSRLSIAGKAVYTPPKILKGHAIHTHMAKMEPLFSPFCIETPDGPIYNAFYKIQDNGFDKNRSYKSD